MEKKKFFQSDLPRIKRSLFEDIKKNTKPLHIGTSLTDEEIYSIYYYTTDDEEFSYIKINTELETNSVTQKTQYLIKSIDTGLKKIIPHDGICVRGESIGGRIHSQLQNILANKKILQVVDVEYVFSKFYTSVSIEHVTTSFLRKPVILTLKSKNRAHDISFISDYPDELELLFQRDSKFIITGIKINSPVDIRISLLEV